MTERAELRKLFQARLASSSSSSSLSPSSSSLSPSPSRTLGSGVATPRVQDKLARYDGAGRLSCVICKTVLTEAAWPVHAVGRQHQTTLRTLRERAAAQRRDEEDVRSGKDRTDPQPHSATPSILPTVPPAAAAQPHTSSSSSHSSPAVPHVPSVSAASDLPADFFSPSAPSALPVAPSSVHVAPSAEVDAVADPQSKQSEGGGERGPAAEADDNEAALRLALAMSRALPVESPSLPPSVSAPLTASSLAVAAALSSFEASLTEAEAGAAERDEERLRVLRLTLEDEDTREARERLQALEAQVRQLKRRLSSRGESVPDGAKWKARKTAAPVSASTTADAVDAPGADLLDELDAAFAWR